VRLGIARALVEFQFELRAKLRPPDCLPRPSRTSVRVGQKAPANASILETLELRIFRRSGNAVFFDDTNSALGRVARNLPVNPQPTKQGEFCRLFQ